MTQLTVRAAAARLGVGYSTLKRWVLSGRVRTSQTAGGHHRIAESEIDRLMSRRVPDAAAPADLGIHLYVPEAGVPVEEPPPAPLSTTDGTTPDAPRPPAGSKSDASRDEDTQGTGTLRITSVPPGADVFIKKKQVGTTPVTVSDLPLDSDVKLELRLDGFQKKRKRVRWGGQTELDVNIKLDAASDDESGGGDPDKAEKSPTASEAPAN